MTYWIGRYELASYWPLVQYVQSELPAADDPDRLIDATMSQALERLESRLALLPTLTLIEHRARSLASICAGASGVRFGRCVQAGRHLDDARRMLQQDNTHPAVEMLRSYLAQVATASSRGIFTPAEHALLAGLASMAADRLAGS